MKSNQNDLYILIRETRDMVHSIKENDLPRLRETQIRLEEQVKTTNGKVKAHTKVLWATASAIGVYVLMSVLNHTFIVGG